MPRASKPATGRAGEHGMRARRIDLRGAFANERFRGSHQRTGGVDDVVHNQRTATAHIADQVHDFADVDIDAALIDDGQRRVEAFGEETGALDAARVGRNDGQIRQVQLPKMLDENGPRERRNNPESAGRANPR